MRWSIAFASARPTATPCSRRDARPARAPSAGPRRSLARRCLRRWRADIPHSQMRVLYLNPFSQEVSGPDESLRALLAPLVASGIEAHVVLPAPGPQVVRYEQVGAAVH